MDTENGIEALETLQIHQNSQIYNLSYKILTEQFDYE